jgi:octaprenyl-diphosphate synthase
MGTITPLNSERFAPASSSTESLSEISALIPDDLGAINRHIEKQLSSDVALIRQMGVYIVAAGGKRLRPLTLVLAARSLDYSGTAHIDLAAVIEFIHTATLLHDDVVDESELRRGRETANDLWGNAASVLVGDFLYSRAFQMMVAVDHMRVMEIMATTTNAIAEGEVMQLLNTHNPNITEQQYLETITRKTARLFESAGRLGAILADAGPATEQALADYGLNLGIAFQIVDDMLDYTVDAEEMGKNAGDDLAEGKATLPLIHALGECSPDQHQILSSAISEGNRDRFIEVKSIIESTGALAYTSRRARDYAEAATQSLETLPASPYRTALADLADFSVSRTY